MKTPYKATFSRFTQAKNEANEWVDGEPIPIGTFDAAITPLKSEDVELYEIKRGQVAQKVFVKDRRSFYDEDGKRIKDPLQIEVNGEVFRVIERKDLVKAFGFVVVLYEGES